MVESFGKVDEEDSVWPRSVDMDNEQTESHATYFKTRRYISASYMCQGCGVTE